MAGLDPGAERDDARVGVAGDELEAGQRTEAAATSMHENGDRLAARSPIERPSRPETSEPSSGAKTATA